MRFPQAAPEKAAACEAAVRAIKPVRESAVIALDRVLAYVNAPEKDKKGVAVNLEPPPIFYADSDAILLAFLGEPRFVKIDGSSLEFGMNTSWDLIRDPGDGIHYLLYRDGWIQAPDLKNGPWTATKTLPKGLKKLPKGGAWDRVTKNVPGKTIEVVPKVFVSETPAELVLTKGRPAFEEIPGTQLAWVTNSQNTLFFHKTESRFYFLAAGPLVLGGRARGALEGRHDEPSGGLREDPEDAQEGVRPRVRPRHAGGGGRDPHRLDPARRRRGPHAGAAGDLLRRRAEVRADRRDDDLGGDQHAERRLQGRDGLLRLLQGRLVPGDGRRPSRLRARTDPGRSRTPFPQEIYTIPPTSPKYNVTYVTVVESTPETVTDAYTAGYEGEVVSSGVVMYGVGYAYGYGWGYPWYYSPYYWGWGMYPPYYGGVTFWAGAYGYGWSAYGPYGGAGYGARYNPATGVYSRGGYAYGPGGAAAWRTGYNPSTGVVGAQRGGANAYGSWKQGAVTNGSDWARGGSVSNSQGTLRGFQTSGGAAGIGGSGSQGQGFVVKDGQGNVYAGHDGNVYKRDSNGNWTSPTGGATPKTSDANRDSLNRDYQSRQSGQRARDLVLVGTRLVRRRRPVVQRRGRAPALRRDD